MTESEKGAAGVVVVVVLFLVLAFAAGLSVGRGYARYDAASAGAGVYIADGRTGKTVFHWVVP